MGSLDPEFLGVHPHGLAVAVDHDRQPFSFVLKNRLEERDEEVAAAWAVELDKRSRDVAAGRVQTVPWETVRAQILTELEQRRASLASS